MLQISKYILVFIAFSWLHNANVCAQQIEEELTIDNGILTLKLDLTRGGAISYISVSGSERNLVNIADEGRYIQQSYYDQYPELAARLADVLEEHLISLKATR
jgi:hypothetical protein